jgi:hypothetical protein
MKKIISLFALALLTMSAWAANTYVKVTSLDQLEAGKKYILVNEEKSCAMGPIAGSTTSYGSAIGVTIISGVIDIEDTDVVELTAHDGGTHSYGPTWNFTYEDGAYMFWNSGNSLSTISTAGASGLTGAKWVPALTDDGVILKNNDDISRILQYNASSPRFACYTSAQQPAVLYVQDENATPPVTVAPPTLPASQEFENSLSVTITNNEEGADLMYALNDGEFTAYEEALTITETTTVHAKAVKGDVESEVVSATYTKVGPVVLNNPYVKVTSVDQLEVGKKYILVNEENSRALGALSNTSTVYGTAEAITINNEIVDINGTSVLELTAHKANGDQGGWIFEFDENHFIAWVTGNSLTSIHNTTGVASLNEQWYANATDDGVILKNRNDQTRILQYNATSPRFACYTSNQQPAVLYVEYVPAEEEGITKLSEANALDDNEAFTFNGDAVVTLYKNNYLFLRDESGYGQIRGVTEGNFENGQVLKPNWEAVKAGENGWAWFTDAEGLSPSGETNAELAAAQKLTGAVDESMLNAYVYVENVTISGGPFPGLPMHSLPLPDGTSIGVTSTLWGMSWPASDSKNIYGIICKVGDKYMFNVASFENYVAPFLRGDVNKDTEVNIADVTALIDKLLNNAEMIPEADCNQDTEMNIADVTALIDYLLSGTWPN